MRSRVLPCCCPHVPGCTAALTSCGCTAALTCCSHVPWLHRCCGCTSALTSCGRTAALISRAALTSRGCTSARADNEKAEQLRKKKREPPLSIPPSGSHSLSPSARCWLALRHRWLALPLTAGSLLAGLEAPLARSPSHCRLAGPLARCSPEIRSIESRRSQASRGSLPSAPPSRRYNSHEPPKDDLALTRPSGLRARSGAHSHGVPPTLAQVQETLGASGKLLPPPSPNLSGPFASLATLDDTCAPRPRSRDLGRALSIPRPPTGPPSGVSSRSRSLQLALSLSRPLPQSASCGACLIKCCLSARCPAAPLARWPTTPRG
jgi:hypothetical protein